MKVWNDMFAIEEFQIGPEKRTPQSLDCPKEDLHAYRSVNRN